jgi:hypothetical protein
MTGVRFTAVEWLRAVAVAAMFVLVCGACWFTLVCLVVLVGEWL